MIRIHKPAAPTKLIQDGSKKAEAHLEDYLQDPIAYQTGKKKFDFASEIYAHDNVRKSLMNCQYRKCCYCEKDIGQSGDIEHFRPRSAYRQKSAQPRQYPGYYWLTYDWENLYLSCRDCNNNKANFFPLALVKNRSQINGNNVSIEEPLLIDPVKLDPEIYIGFRAEQPYAKSGKKQGKFTIDILKLDREDLKLARRSHLAKMKMLYKFIQKSEKNPGDRDLREIAFESQKVLNDAISDRGVFSSATRSAIADRFGRVNIV